MQIHAVGIRSGCGAAMHEGEWHRRPIYQNNIYDSIYIIFTCDIQYACCMIKYSARPSVFSRTTVVISKAKQDHSCFAIRHRMLKSACLCQPSCCVMSEASWSHGNRSFASANATPPSTNLSLQISRKTTLSARKQRAKHPPRSKHRPDLCKMKDFFHRQRAFTVCLQIFNSVEAFVQLGRKDDNFTRCDAWCQSKDICNCKFHALWMWFTLTHVILHHFHIFYPCIKTTVVNPQQKEWRQHVPDVFRCMEARSLCGHFRIHRRPQIPRLAEWSAREWSCGHQRCLQQGRGPGVLVLLQLFGCRYCVNESIASYFI